MVKCRLYILVVLIFTGFLLNAQVKDTSAIDLNEITISSVKSKQLNTIKKTRQLDSITKNEFNNLSLSEVLSVNTPVFIKNYGPANLSSASFRGGNASQSPVIWNGFNIMNPMLGQNDFSQLPAFVFDNIGIEYGGSSAIWGSGAMGGSIHLNNVPQFKRGLHSLITLGLGSFDTRKLNSNIHYSTDNFSSNTKVYYVTSKNNFDYRDTTIKNQIHADYKTTGFLQEIGSKILNNHFINLRAWYHKSERNLPPVLGDITGTAHQSDENLKLTADYTYKNNRVVPSVRFAYFDDVLNYTDSAASVFSKNNVKTFIAEADAKYTLNRNHTFFIGGNYTTFNALTNNYSQAKHTFEKEALLAGYNLCLMNNKLLFELLVRQEFSSALSIPTTGNTGLSYQIFKELKLKVNAARVYRLPTLNDLFWANSGNPDLKPEEGYTFEGGLDFKWDIKYFTLQSELTYFDKKINNWISWVPGAGGNPTPINLSEVYSRGTETTSRIMYKQNKLFCQLGFNSAYTLSEVIKSSLANDASVHKQLIYTPRYNYGAQFSLGIQDFVVSYYHNYIGYRFTSSDNTGWLTPYNVANVKFSYKYNVSFVGVTTLFQINNLFNEDYKVIAQRPMPLRNYEISLTLTYHKPKTIKQPII